MDTIFGGEPLKKVLINFVNTILKDDQSVIEYLPTTKVSLLTPAWRDGLVLGKMVKFRYPNAFDVRSLHWPTHRGTILSDREAEENNRTIVNSIRRAAIDPLPFVKESTLSETCIYRILSLLIFAPLTNKLMDYVRDIDTMYLELAPPGITCLEFSRFDWYQIVCLWQVKIFRLPHMHELMEEGKNMAPEDYMVIMSLWEPDRCPVEAQGDQDRATYATKVLQLAKQLGIGHYLSDCDLLSNDGGVHQLFLLEMFLYWIEEKLLDHRKLSLLMRRRNPSLNPPYEWGMPDQTEKTPYVPLDPQKNEIRLLSLHPSESMEAPIIGLLYHSTIKDSINADNMMNHVYMALSYVWGEATSSNTITLNEREVPVRENLFLALQALRLKDGPLLIWVDALCINQNDTAERNHQVGIMSLIYRNAKAVVMWLGPQTSDSDMAMNLTEIYKPVYMAMREAASSSNLVSLTDVKDIVRRQRQDIVYGNGCRHLWQALGRFVSCAYFSRAWIVQEVLSNTNTWIRCGSRQIQWVVFKHLCLEGVNEPVIIGLRTNHLLNMRHPVVTLALANFKEAAKGHTIPLLKALVVGRYRQATEKIDKVYSILSLADRDRYPLAIDYGSDIMTVSIAVAKLIIETDQNLDILSACYGHDQVGTPSRMARSDWPTWVPDWTLCIDHEQGLVLRDILEYRTTCHYQAAKDSPPSINFDSRKSTLGVKGVQVATIAYSRGEYIHRDDPHGMPKPWMWFYSTYKCSQLANAYGDSAATADAFGRLMLLGRDFGYGGKCTIKKPYRLAELFVDGQLPPGTPKIGCRCPETGHSWNCLEFNYQSNIYRLKYTEEVARFFQMSLGGFEHMLNRKTVLESLKRWGSTFFVTDTGHFGRSNAWAADGDMICIFSGGKTPYLLRPAGNKSEYRLLGECYVEGFMEGEMAHKLSETQEFVLI